MNVLEQYPLSAKPSEKPETTVNFLIRLFRYADILNQIQSTAKELHVDPSKVRSQTPEQMITPEEIETILMDAFSDINQALKQAHFHK